jgi:hypothetical protein
MVLSVQLSNEQTGIVRPSTESRSKRNSTGAEHFLLRCRQVKQPVRTLFCAFISLRGFCSCPPSQSRDHVFCGDHIKMSLEANHTQVRANNTRDVSCGRWKRGSLEPQSHDPWSRLATTHLREGAFLVLDSRCHFDRQNSPLPGRARWAVVWTANAL